MIQSNLGLIIINPVGRRMSKIHIHITICIRKQMQEDTLKYKFEMLH